MDAADDREIKLQRASGDLVKEFSAKLPSLLWKPRTGQTDSRVPRRRTLASKTEKLVSLVSYPYRLRSPLDIRGISAIQHLFIGFILIT